MILCDFAEAINGKLYVMGGGWDQIQGPNPVNCAVAVQFKVPWTQTNQKHRLAIKLLADDGPYVAPNGQHVGIDGEFEVGRPPGHTPGDPLSNTIAVRFDGLPLPTGGYRFSLEVDGTEVSAQGFRVTRPDGWSAPQ